MLLHELAHAVHVQLFGAHNAAIRAAYLQARERKLYDESTTVYGRKIVPYARTNELEYFAELSRAYLHKLNYYPFTRDDLKKHDPLGYKMMELTWGKAKQIDAALRLEGEKTASRMLTSARRLQADGKRSAAQATLEKLIEFYPHTPSTPAAKQLLEKMKAP